MKKFSIFAIAALAAVAMSTSVWAQDNVQPSPSDTPVAEAPPIADGTTAPAPVVMSSASCGCSQGIVSAAPVSGCSTCATSTCCPQPRRVVMRRNRCCAAPAPVCNTCNTCAAPAPTCNTCATPAPTCNTCAAPAPACNTCNTCAPQRTFVAFRRASSCNTCATPAPSCNTCATACATPCNSCGTVAQVSYQEPVATAVTADSVMAAPVVSNAGCCGSTPVVSNNCNTCAPAATCCNQRRRPLASLRGRIGSRRCCR